MLRALIKTGSSRALHWTGVDRLKAAWDGAAAFPMVVGYHRVVNDFASEARRSIPAMLISVAMLERHLDWLGERFDLTIPRRLLWEHSCLDADGSFSAPVMSCHLNGLFDFLGSCDHRSSTHGSPVAAAARRAG